MGPTADEINPASPNAHDTTTISGVLVRKVMQDSGLVPSAVSMYLSRYPSWTWSPRATEHKGDTERGWRGRVGLCSVVECFGGLPGLLTTQSSRHRAFAEECAPLRGSVRQNESRSRQLYCTVDSFTVEHGRADVAFWFYLRLSLVWDFRMGMFQLSGFYYVCATVNISGRPKDMDVMK